MKCWCFTHCLFCSLWEPSPQDTHTYFHALRVCLFIMVCPVPLRDKTHPLSPSAEASRSSFHFQPTLFLPHLFRRGGCGRVSFPSSPSLSSHSPLNKLYQNLLSTLRAYLSLSLTCCNSSWDWLPHRHPTAHQSRSLTCHPASCLGPAAPCGLLCPPGNCSALSNIWCCDLHATSVQI